MKFPLAVSTLAALAAAFLAVTHATAATSHPRQPSARRSPDRRPRPPRATVVVDSGTRGSRSVRVDIAELAQIVRGKNPRNRPLFDRANRLGYWIRAQVDTVRSLDQQYQP